MPDEVKDPQPDTKQADEGKLSPKEALELARLQAHTAELEKQNRDMTVRDTVRNLITKTGITFHPSPEDLFKLVASEPGVVIRPSATGDVLHCEKDGQDISFDELVKDFTLRNQYVADRRTLRSLKQDVTRVTCKDDLPEREDRIKFIEANGDDAFGRLPQHRGTTHQDPAKTMTAREYLSLPMPSRAKLCGELSELQITRILQRKEKP